MGISRLVFLGLVVSFGLKAQNFDSMEVKAFELGLPESLVEEVGFTLADKYGKDSTDWPVWARERPDPRKGMDLDRIDFSSLLLNDSMSLNLDMAQPFRTDTLRGSISNRLSIFYYQDDLIHIFNDNDTIIHFLSMLSPLKEGAQKLKFQRDGRYYDLSRLDSVKSALPKSYDWRDGIPSGITTGFHFSKVDEVDLTVVLVGTYKSNEIIELHYYKGDLVYVYHSF